jgi:hypothetical protein
MSENSGFRRLVTWKKVVVLGFLCAAFALVLTAVWLDGHFCHNRPKDPSPQEGRVYKTYVCHGAVVYLTRLEYISLRGLPFTFMLLFLLGVFFGQRWARGPRINRRESG